MGMGDRVRFYRRVRRMSQRQLAGSVRMAPEQLNRYEMNRVRPTLPTARRLARALRVTLSDLLVE